MERLWAPWRMEYIKRTKKNSGCIFCDKPEQDSDIENLILFRGRTCFVIMNFYPYNNGHLMVVPYRHLCDFHALSAEERNEMMALVDASIDVIKADMQPQGFNLGMNIGSVAGAGIAGHLHFHIVPRWNGDTNFMPVTGHTKVISEVLTETCRHLRKKFTQYMTR